jgi:hypothetical protein
MTNPFADPIRYGLIFGIGGGITFSLAVIAFNYFTRGEFSWVSILGGIVWFITSMTLSFYAYKVTKKK